MKLLSFITTLLFFSATLFAAVDLTHCEDCEVDPSFFLKDNPPISLPQSLKDFQKLEEKVFLDIKKVEADIAKNNETIQKSQTIIALAQQRDDANAKKAQLVASEALNRANSAKSKNLETLHLYQSHLDALKRKIEILGNIASNEPPTTCNCETLTQKYNGFKKAIKDFSKTTQMNTQEYEKWNKEFNTALKEGVDALLDTVLFGMDNFIKTKEEKLVGLKKEIDRYQQQLSTNGLKNEYLIQQTHEKLEKAQTHFMKGRITNITVDGAMSVKKAYNIYKSIKHSMELSKIEIDKGYALVADIQKNTETKIMFGDSISTFIESAVEYEHWLRKSNAMLGRLNLAVSSFVVLRDVGYAGTHFKLSLDRLIQFGEAGEENYKAVQSLIEHKKKIEAELKKCGCDYTI